MVNCETRGPVATTSALSDMATIGHSSHVAALRCQQATTERSRAIAEYLHGVIHAVPRSAAAPLRRNP
jgi:hypothetical protein